MPQIQVKMKGRLQDRTSVPGTFVHSGISNAACLWSAALVCGHCGTSE